jgi:hypothetical protein
MLSVCRVILVLVQDLELLTPEQFGRLATPLALTTVHVAQIDNDSSFWLAGVSDTLMLALGLRRSACTYSVRWVVRTVLPACDCFLHCV